MRKAYWTVWRLGGRIEGPIYIIEINKQGWGTDEDGNKHRMCELYDNKQTAIGVAISRVKNEIKRLRRKLEELKNL